MFSFSTDNYHNSFASFFKHFNDNGLFNERQRRITAGLFALGLGEKGIKFISDMSGLDQRTIQSGIAEIKSGQIVREDGRIRAEGAGRPDFLNYQPDLLDKIQEICDKSTYGSPEGDILYKNMSLRGIADELKKEGIQINKDTVGKYLEEIRYSKQQNQKLLQVGEPHPQRDEILDQVFKTKMEFEENNLPCLSIDAKNKINKGNFSNPGQEYLPEQFPRPT